MSTMVERVARAICLASGNDPDGQWMPPPKLGWQQYEDEARAAIAAMREPTEAMVEAAISGDNGLGLDRHLYLIWRDMIDAALKAP